MDYRKLAALPIVFFSLALAYFLLSAPSYLLQPRFGSISYSINVHGWPEDVRVSIIEVLLIWSVLLWLRTKKSFRLAAYLALAFSALNFALPVAIDYGLNLSSASPFPGFWSILASDAFRTMVALRQTVDMPLNFLTWLLSMVVIFALVRVGRGVRLAAVDSVWLAFAALTAFAVGSHIVDPKWATSYVTLLQAGTALQWFSNQDLLAVSLLGLLLFSAAKVRLERPSL